MDLSEAFRRRRMVRSYRPDPVDPGALERVLAAAASAPSAGHTRGQELVVVTSPRLRREVARLAGEDEHVMRGLDPWLSVAPVHVVVVTSEAAYRRRYAMADKAAVAGPDGWNVPYWWFDAGAVVMTLLLAAAGEGLGAGFLGAHALSPGLDELLGLPASVDVVGIVTIGHPSDASRPVRRRDAPSIHREGWDVAGA